MARTYEDLMEELDQLDDEYHEDREEVADYLKRLRQGREIVFNTLKQAITERDFEIRVVSDSQFEIEFFGNDAPPILLVTVDAPVPPGAFDDHD
jgi:hypothetical protein